MTYIKGGLLVLALLVCGLLAKTLYYQRQELHNADLYIKQDMEQFAQSGIEGIDNIQDNFNRAVEDAENTYSEELGL